VGILFCNYFLVVKLEKFIISSHVLIWREHETENIVGTAVGLCALALKRRCVRTPARQMHL